MCTAESIYCNDGKCDLAPCGQPKKGTYCETHNEIAAFSPEDVPFTKLFKTSNATMVTPITSDYTDLYKQSRQFFDDVLALLKNMYRNAIEREKRITKDTNALKQKLETYTTRLSTFQHSRAAKIEQLKEIRQSNVSYEQTNPIVQGLEEAIRDLSEKERTLGDKIQALEFDLASKENMSKECNEHIELLKRKLFETQLAAQKILPESENIPPSTTTTNIQSQPSQNVRLSVREIPEEVTV